MKDKNQRYDLIHIHPAAIRNSPGFMFIPAGLFGVMNEVRLAGFHLQMINEPLEISMDSSFDISDYLRKTPATCYSLDVHWHEHLYGGISLARLIKKLYPEAVVVLGGLTSSFFASEILDFCPEIDFAIDGFGEGSLVPIIDYVVHFGKPAKTSYIVKSDLVPNLDALDLTTRHFLLHHEEYLKCSVHFWDCQKTTSTFWLKNGFGCKQNCSFCGGSHFTQKKIFSTSNVIYRSAERLASDLMKLENEGVWMTSLTHDTSIIGSGYWKKLHRLLRKEEKKCGVYMEAEGLPDSQFLADFARTFDLSRSVIALSPLCYHEILRKKYGKRFDNDEFWQCLVEFKKHNIQLVLYFIASLFDHVLNSRDKEMRFQELIQLEFQPLFIFNSFLTVDPGSPIYGNPEHHSMELSLRGFEDYYRRCKLRSQNLEYDKFGYKELITKV